MRIFLSHCKEDTERPRKKAGFSRQPQVKQTEQLKSNISVNSDSKRVTYQDTEEFFCAEPNVLRLSSDDENFCLLPFSEEDSQVQNIDNSFEVSNTGLMSDSLVSIHFCDQEDADDRSSEEIVMSRHNVGVRHADNIMFL